MHVRDFGKRRLDRRERARFVDAIDSNLDERSKQRPGASRAHGQVLSACA
jgi:hypothetical protein